MKSLRSSSPMSLNAEMFMMGHSCGRAERARAMSSSVAMSILLMAMTAFS